MTLWLGRVALSVGVQARLASADATPEDRRWLGFAYGSWLPRAHLAPPDCVPALSGYWLCFHGSVTVWPRSARIRGIRIT